MINSTNASFMKLVFLFFFLLNNQNQHYTSKEFDCFVEAVSVLAHEHTTEWSTHFQRQSLHPVFRYMVSLCSSLMQCLFSDIGGAPAALWLMTAAATLDPFTARHYIRRHYLNTQQSEIEFRAPSPAPPPKLLLLVQLARSRIPFSPYC